MVYNNHLSRLNLSRIEPMPVRNYIVDIRDLIVRINSFRVAFHPIKNEIHSIIIRREIYIYIYHDCPEKVKFLRKYDFSFSIVITLWTGARYGSYSKSIRFKTTRG